MLNLKNIYAGYTKENMIIKGIDLTINEDEVIAIVGQNGSGKSTLAKVILNQVPFIEGDITFFGESLRGYTTTHISQIGIGFFMQGGRTFPNLTVDENLDFAGSLLSKKGLDIRKNEVKDYFELLKKKERIKLKASYLSGGEQHQLALAMVLMLKPKFLILDEPSAGLSPYNVNMMYEVLNHIKKTDVKTILIIEQNVSAAVKFSNCTILLRNGKIAEETSSQKLNSSENINEFFF